MNHNKLKEKTIAFVCGEYSGEILAADFLQTLKSNAKKNGINLTFIGVGGDYLKQKGFDTAFNYEAIAVNGFTDVFKRLFSILSFKKKVFNYFLKQKIDLFIGFDAKSFNLSLAKQLHKKNIKTMQVVAPQVWASRPGRAKKIAKFLDALFVLFPFEKPLFEKHGLKTICIGHTMARQIPLKQDNSQLLQTYNIQANDTVLTVMPGGRTSEVAMHLDVFLQAAKKLKQNIPNLKVFIPVVSKQHQDMINQHYQSDFVTVGVGKSKDFIAISNAVLVASGTATLEVALLKKPMVVAYKLNKLNHFILKLIIKTKWIALPNVLLQKSLVPELIQDDVTCEKIIQTLIPLLQHSQTELISELNSIHQSLLIDANNQICEEVFKKL